MAFEIHPCTLEDMPAVSHVLIEAHRNDPIVSRLLPPSTVSLSTELAFWTACHTAEFYKPGRRFFKLVDSATAAVVGMLNMHEPYSLSREETDDSGAYADDVPLPVGANVPLAEQFFGQMAVHEARNLDHRSMYFVNVLAVLPTYQRRGLGARLLGKIMDMADAVGAKIYLESTGAGKPLYMRYGWVELEYFEVDTKPYGGMGQEKMTCMIREPKVVGRLRN